MPNKNYLQGGHLPRHENLRQEMVRFAPPPLPPPSRELTLYLNKTTPV